VRSFALVIEAANFAAFFSRYFASIKNFTGEKE